MPNHYTVIGLAAMDWDRVAAITGSPDDGEIDFSPLVGVDFCEKVKPMPYELRTIVGGTAGRAGVSAYRYRNKATMEFLVDPQCPGTGDDSPWEIVPLESAEVGALLEKFGAVSWDAWCPQNWGTSRGTYATKIHSLGGDGSPMMIEFQCAWGPPNADTMRAIEGYLWGSFALKDIKWLGHNPYDGSTVHLADSAKEG